MKKIWVSIFFSEQCHNLVSGIYKTSCKTGEGLEEMFTDIAFQLVNMNRSRIELQSMEQHGFKIIPYEEEQQEDNCMCWKQKKEGSSFLLQ